MPSRSSIGLFRKAPVFAALWFLPACGSDPAALTCEILESPDNCWAQVAAAGAACLPPATETGVLAADRASCTFSNGARVIFDDPLPDSTEQLQRLGITIEVDGQSCARFVDTFENRIEIEAGDLSATAQLRGGVFSLQCGDGRSYETDFDTLFTCQEPYSAPTDSFLVTPELVTYSLWSVATAGELFRCAPAAASM